MAHFYEIIFLHHYMDVTPYILQTENFLGNKRRLPTFHFPVLLSSWPTTFQFKSSVTTCHSPNGHGSKNLWGSCLTSPVLLDTIYDFGPYTTSPGLKMEKAKLSSESAYL